MGNTTIPQASLTYASATTTLNDLVGTIQGAFNLPATDGTPANNPSVSVNAADTVNDNLPDGSVVVRGQPGTAFGIPSISLTAVPAAPTDPTPTEFDANSAFTASQNASDAQPQETSEQVYDASGAAHTLELTFTPSNVPGVWHWDAATAGGEKIVGGNNGTVTFGQDGTPTSFTYADGSSAFSFDPMNGLPIETVNLNVGTPGSLSGVTQFKSATTVAAASQDGYTMGNLSTISIDQDGEITGAYTNGTKKSLARIFVADFTNPAGCRTAAIT